jgi:hypothetical protein
VLARGAVAARLALWRAAWRSRWLELSALVLITIVLVSCIHRRWDQPPMLAPLLAVPPALAGIGAVTVRRPLAYGGVSLLAAVFVAIRPNEFAAWLPAVTMVTTVVITAVATLGTAVSVRQGLLGLLRADLMKHVGALGLGFVHVQAGPNPPSGKVNVPQFVIVPLGP